MNQRCSDIRHLIVSRSASSSTTSYRFTPKVIFFLCVSLQAWSSERPSIPQGSLEIVDRYGQPLRTFVPEDNQINRPVSLDSVSPTVILATLAAEDKRFFSHPGVDLQAAARALWQNTRHGRVVSGGSTLTQQLVRILEPRPKTWHGKFKEAFQALVLEHRASKREILETYLNQVNYGNGCKGIEAASRVYFEVPSRDLSLAQAALLAGIPKSPTNGEPIRHWKTTIGRQQTVLRRLHDWGWIDSESYRFAAAERMIISKRRRPWLAPHFTDQIRQRLAQSGQRPQGAVITSVDAGLQETLEKLLIEHLKQLTAYHVTNGALLVLDNATGDILAWVGSANFFDEHHQGQVDGVTALRQPGSALKPFVYGLAFSQGMRTSDILPDEPLFDQGYMPKNYDETYHGLVRMREALACSYNVPAVVLGQRLGIDPILHILHEFGLKSLDRPAEHYGLGMVLGNGEVSLLELTNAYASLARGGIWMPVHFLGSDSGETRQVHRALDRESAYLVTDVLADNAARAPAFGLNSPFHGPFVLAAKTGTTKDYRDNWAMGYTPDWTIGVWVGNFDGKPMRGVSGITGAAPLLRDAAFAVAERYKTRPFPVPSGIREREVCPESGKLPTPDCPSLMREMFRVDHLPTEVCDMHHASLSTHSTSSEGLKIKFPVEGDIFKINPRMARSAQRIRLESNVSDPTARVGWTVDSRRVPAEGSVGWWTLQPGRHTARVSIESVGRRLVSPVISFTVVP